LTLSRRHERRAEQRGHDKSRDCKFGKFGLHQGCLRWLQDYSKPRACDSVPVRGKHFANFIFKNSFTWRSLCNHRLSKHPSPCEHRICAKRFHWLVRLDTRQSSSKTDRGKRQCSWSGSRALDAKNAEKRWRCGSSSLKDPVSIRGLSNARNALAPKPWWRRSPADWMSLQRHLRS
jgi:hypothetical protein